MIIIKGIDKVYIEHFFELDDGGGYDLRGHSRKVKVQKSRLQLQQGFFTKELSAYGTVNHLLSSRLRLSTFSKRGWTIGVGM